MRLPTTYLFTVLLLVGCSKDNSLEPPETALRSGTVTVDTRQLPDGFSFSKGDTVSAPFQGATWPDFEFYIATTNSPKPVGVSLAGKLPDGSYRPTFRLKESFSRLDSARKYFQSIAGITDTGFTPAAYHLSPYQVYSVSTNSGACATILILQNGPNIDTSYATLSFDWIGR
jgi:hypothetical protein